jgi:hypothetical protein
MTRSLTVQVKHLPERLQDAPRPGRTRVCSRAGAGLGHRPHPVCAAGGPDPLELPAARRRGRHERHDGLYQRIWLEAGLQPHRTETFKWSADPELEA